MKRTTKRVLAGLGFIAATAGFVGCGNETGMNDLNPNQPGTPGDNLAQDLGAINFSCADGSTSQQGQQQQKQIPYQQQQQAGCSKDYQFQQSKVHDFDMTYDCGNKVVTVKNKGADQKSAQIPIQSDGTVKGKMQFQQQIQQQQGGQKMVCWVEYDVTFDGKASCNNQQSGGEPSKLALNTTVELKKTSKEALDTAGIPNDQSGASPTPNGTRLPIPGPGVTLRPPFSPSPSPSASPSVMPSPTGEPGQTPTPTPSMSSSPSPSPTPTGHVVCVVENPCPTVGKAELSCPAPQQ